MFLPLLLLFWPLEHQETVSMKKNNFQFTSSFLDHAPHASCVPGCARNSGTQVPVKLTLHIPRRHAHGTFTLYSGSPDPSSGMFASGCRSKVRKEPPASRLESHLSVFGYCALHVLPLGPVAAPPIKLKFLKIAPIQKCTSPAFLLSREKLCRL